MFVKDTTDTDWISSDDNADAIIIPFLDNPYRFEYDLASESSDHAGPYHDNDTASEPTSDDGTPATAMLVVCQESDVEFFADYSDSDDDANSDAEIPIEVTWALLRIVGNLRYTSVRSDRSRPTFSFCSKYHISDDISMKFDHPDLKMCPKSDYPCPLNSRFTVFCVS